MNIIISVYRWPEERSFL